MVDSASVDQRVRPNSAAEAKTPTSVATAPTRRPHTSDPIHAGTATQKTEANSERQQIPAPRFSVSWSTEAVALEQRCDYAPERTEGTNDRGGDRQTTRCPTCPGHY